MRLCRCGALVSGRCEKCQPKPKHKQTTAERGYGHDWRLLSESYRIRYPLCQVCEMEDRVTAVAHCHHIVKIADAPHLRLDWSNLLSVCGACHERVERDEGLARRAKKWLGPKGEAAGTT